MLRSISALCFLYFSFLFALYVYVCLHSRHLENVSRVLAYVFFSFTACLFFRDVVYID